MSRHGVVATSALGLLLAVAAMDRALASPLIAQPAAAAHGLSRAWYTQVRLDPGRDRVTHLRLVEKTDQFPDTLFVQTHRAVVHAIDAETGRTLWVRMIGQPQYPTMPIGANARMLAVVNGTTLYILDRADGKILREDRVRGVPAAGTVMSGARAFVPLVSGEVVAYRLFEEQSAQQRAEAAAKNTAAKKPAEPAPPPAPQEAGAPQPSEIPTGPPAAPPDQKDSPKLSQRHVRVLTCVSFGRVTSQPVVTRDDDLGEFVAWSTTRGLFVGRIDPVSEADFAVQYQLATSSEIVSQPTILAPTTAAPEEQGLIFTASEDGEIHATLARHGTQIWKFAVGEPILEPVIPIGQRVYAATQLGGMYCLEAKDGQRQWWTAKATQFVAASKDRVYAADAQGRILVLDAKTGARQDALDASALPLKLRNFWTDRLYLASPTGLVQCLREIEQTEPIRHRPPVTAAAPKPTAPARTAPARAPGKAPAAPAKGPAKAPAKGPGEAAPATPPPPDAAKPGENPFAE